MGCARGATVLLAYDPRSATAWLRDLVDDHPSLGLALCEIHAERTSVPMGWECVDERRPAWQSYEVESPFEADFEPLSDLDIAPPQRRGGRAEQAAPVTPEVDASMPEGWDLPLAAEVRSRQRVEEEVAFENGPMPAAATPHTRDGVQLEMSAFAEVDALGDDDETFDAAAWLAEDETEDNFDEIFGLGPDNDEVTGTPFDPSEETDSPALDGHHADAGGDSDWVSATLEDLAPQVDGEPESHPDTAASGIDTAVMDDAGSPDTEQVDGDRTNPAPETGSVTEPEASDDFDASPNLREADISFDDIFPPKVNLPDEPDEPHNFAPGRVDQSTKARTFSERDQQRQLFGSDDVDADFDRHASQNKPVARNNSTGQGSSVNAPKRGAKSAGAGNDTSAPITGPPRIEPRPAWMPSRHGNTAKLHVESSSPLLGRAFGFVQRD